MKRLSLAVFIGLFLSFAVSLSVGAQSAVVLQWSDIPQNAMTSDGLAKVIVQVNVPNLAKLTEASASIRPLQADDTNAEKVHNTMIAADRALSAAIASATSALLSTLPSSSHRLNRTYDFLPYLALDVQIDAFLKLRTDPRVLAIYPDVPSPLPDYGPSPESKSLPGSSSEASEPTTALPSMDTTITLIGADKAWARGYTGSGWHVAVLDTGIRRSHQFFQSKNIVEACFSTPGHCPNGQNTMLGPGAAAHHSNAYTGYDHGTHVAGTAAGKNLDGTLFGVAKDAGIIAINVFSRFSASECDGSPCVMSYSSDQIAGLDYVYGLRGTHNIGSGNMSLGGGHYSSYCDGAPQKTAIDLLRNANIPTAISTGNDGYCGAVGAPACISSAIAVMAATKGDAEASFNNWHPVVADIFAPGVSILSATGESDTSYARWNGTSMASPHMAGALTLMRQYQPTDAPATHLTRLTQRGPSITTPCPGGGSKPRLYVDNFSGDLTDIWKTEIGIVNIGSTTLTGTLRGFDSAGAQVWSQAVSLSALGRKELDVTQAAADISPQIKYMRLDITSGTAVGYQKFYQTGKYRVGLEALPRANQSGLFMPHIHSSSQWWTGLGIVNTTSNAKNLGFTFSNGVQAAKSIGSGAHDAFLISELVGAGEFRGSAVVSNGEGIVGLQLFGSDQQLSGISLSDNSSHHLIFPHVDQTNDWWTGIGVYNPTSTSTQLNVKAYDTHGNLVQAWDNYLELAPYQRHVAATTFPAGTAWFSIESPTSPIMGFELFGVTTQDRLAGYSVVDLGTPQGVFPKIETSGWTGIAMVNIGDSSATITLEARNDAGAVIASRDLALGAGAKMVDVAENLFPGENLTPATYIRFTSDQHIVGFQLNNSTDNTMLDAIPALGSAATKATTTLFFPHIHAE